MSKELKEGDSLAPFLFLIATEGLKGLMDKALEQQKFVPRKKEHKRWNYPYYNMQMTLLLWVALRIKMTEL
jgi:hypothetical protein